MKRWILALSIIIFLCSVGFAFCSAADDSDPTTHYRQILSKEPNNVNALVGLGDVYINLRKGPEAVAVLEKAHALEQESLRVSPMLGLAYILTDNHDKAVAVWQSFVRKYPKTNVASRLKKQITFLLYLEAARWAKQSIRQEKEISLAGLEVDTVAVTYFGERGLRPEMRPLRKALTAMIITDLSKIHGLHVVERIKMQRLLKELQFAASGLVDEKSSPRIGRLLGAGKIVSGNMTGIEPSDLQIMSLLTNVTTGRSIGEQDSQGKMQEFFRLQRAITLGILKDMGVRLTSSEQVLMGQYRFKSFEAIRLYGEALDAQDDGEWSNARKLFAACAKLDPDGPCFDERQSAPADQEATTDVGKIRTAIVAAATLDDSALRTTGTSSADTTATETSPDEDSKPVSEASTYDATTVTQTQNVTTIRQTRPVQHIGWIMGTLNQLGNANFYEPYFAGTLDLGTSSVTFQQPGPPGFYSITFGNFLTSTPTIDSINVAFTPLSGVPVPISRVEMGFNEYQEWGYWTQPIPMTSGPNSYYFINKAYYLAGDATTEAQMNALRASGLSGLYSGPAFGTWYDRGTGASADLTGTFSLNINFASTTNQVTNINLLVAGGGQSASITNGTAYFWSSNSFLADPAALTTAISGATIVPGGQFNGTVYGPTGEMVGGGWFVSGGQTIASGIYRGSR